MPQLKTSSNPQGQIKRRLQKLNLIPDHLSANVAKIKFYLTTMAAQHVSREQQEQELFAALEGVLPRLFQPANFFLNDTHDVLNQLIEELLNLEKRLLQTKVIDLEVNVALQNILTIYREAQAAWKAATPEQQAILKKPKAQIAMPWSVSDGKEDLGFYYIENDLALKLLSLTAEGENAKENETGNHAVYCHKCGDGETAFYKPNSAEGHNPIDPCYEGAIGAFLREITGFAITPEIDVFAISNVTVIQAGKPQQIRRVVQVSQGMGDMSLNEFLAQHVNDPTIFDRLDMDKFSGLITGLLMANPVDGNGNNYRVKIEKDSLGQIIHWYPVPIDNDEGFRVASISLVESFTYKDKQKFSTRKNYIELKDVLFFFQAAMDKPLSPEFVQRFLAQQPMVVLLKFLAMQYEQNTQYERLKDLDKLVETDFVTESGASALDLPLKLDPKLIPSIKNKFESLQRLMAQNPNMTHRQLFELMEPLVANAYQVIQARTALLHNEMTYGKKIRESYGFMHGGDAVHAGAPTLQELLGEQFSEAVSQHYNQKERDTKKNRDATLEHEIEKFIQAIDFKTDTQTRLALLRLIGQYLPFVKKLPNLNPEQLNQFFLEALKNNDTYSVKALLQLGADINYNDATNGKTALHIALLAENISIDLIKVLLAQPGRKTNVADNQGNTPIFSVIDSENLKLLVQAGENIEYQNAKDANAPTLLDRAMLHKNFHWFSVLVTEHHAGRNIDPQKALQFVREGMQTDKDAGDWNKVCQILRRENAEFARLSLLETMTQLMPGETPSGFEITGVSSNALKINTSTVKQLFTPDGTPKRDNTDYGCRAVAQIKKDGQIEAWAKFHPESPVEQQIARCVSDNLAQFFTTKSSLASSELCAFVGPDNKTYAMQISQHVEGINLQRVVENKQQTAELNKKLDQQSFSQLFIFTLLLNPKDDKFDQMIVRKFMNKYGEEAFELVLIEWEQILGETVIREKGIDGQLHRKLQVKSGIYLLDAMLKTFDTELRDKLLQLNPEEFLQAVFTQLVAIDAKNKQIFGEKTIQELCDLAIKDAKIGNAKDGKGSILGMFFTNEIVDGLLNKLKKIQESLRANPTITCLELLSAVIPEIGVVVEAQFHLPPHQNHPHERFKNLYEAHYEEAAEAQKSTNKAVSSTTHLYSKQVSGKEHKVKLSSTTTLASALIVTGESIKDREQFGPSKALNRLKMFQTQRASIATVKEELKKDKIESFVGLYFDEHRAEVLRLWQAEVVTGKSIFDLMSKETRKIVFKNLKGAMTTLDLSSCESIEDKQLSEILKNLPNLRRLILNGCKKLTAKALMVIEEYSYSLEVLELNGLQWKEVKIELLNLRRITGQHTAFEGVVLIAPRLEVIDFADSKLAGISLQGSHLKKLDLRGNNKLPRENMVDLIGQSVELLKHPQNIHLDTPLVATDIIRLCLFYGSSIWTADNVQLITTYPEVSLLGNALTQADLNFIMGLSDGIQKIDLQGTRIDGQAFREMIKTRPTLQNITLNDFKNIQTTNSLPIHLEVVANVFVSTHQGEWLIGGAKGQIEWLDRHLRSKQKLYFGETITAMTLLPDGRVVCGFFNAKIQVFPSINELANSKSIKPIQELQAAGENDVVVELKYSAKLARLIGVSKKGVLRIWDMAVQHVQDAQEKKDQKKKKDGKAVYKCVFKQYDRLSSNITALELLTEKTFVVGDADGGFAVWDLETATLITTFKLDLKQIGIIKKVAPNLVAVVSQTKPGEVNIINLTTGTLQQCIAIHQSHINCLQLLTEGGLLATGDDQGVVKISDIRTGRNIFTSSEYPNEIIQVAMIGHNRLAIATKGVQQADKSYRYPVHTVSFNNKKIPLSQINTYKGNICVKRVDLNIHIIFETSNSALLKQWSDLIKATFDKDEVSVGASQEGLVIRVKNFAQLMTMFDWIKVLARDNYVEFVKQNSLEYQDLASSQNSDSSLSTSTEGDRVNSLPPSPILSARKLISANRYFDDSPFDDVESLGSSPLSMTSYNSLSPNPNPLTSSLSSSSSTLSSSPEKLDPSPSLSPTLTPRMSVLVTENSFMRAARPRSGHVSPGGSWTPSSPPNSNKEALNITVFTPN